MEQANIGSIIKSLTEKYNIKPIKAFNIYSKAQEKVYGYSIRNNDFVFLDRNLDIKAYHLADRYLRLNK